MTRTRARSSTLSAPTRSRAHRRSRRIATTSPAMPARAIGSCGGMFTYNTMQTFIGVVGMQPLHMVAPPSDDPAPDQTCFRPSSSTTSRNMIAKDLKPRDIVVREASAPDVFPASSTQPACWLFAVMPGDCLRPRDRGPLPCPGRPTAQATGARKGRDRQRAHACPAAAMAARGSPVRTLPTETA